MSMLHEGVVTCGIRGDGFTRKQWLFKPGGLGGDAAM